jgi:hypothetical protein
MTMFDSRIAATWNVALNSLVNIETIKPSNDPYKFVAPVVYGTYYAGIQRTRGDGTITLSGSAYLVWLFKVLTRLQYEYLRTTYCSGGFSGKVTIYSRAGTSTYARYNAVMVLPAGTAPVDGQFYAFKDYPVQMTRLVAI